MERPSSPGRPLRNRPAPATPPSTTSNTSTFQSSNPNFNPTSSSNSASNPRSSLYHDPIIDELCQISTFQSNYSTNDFISSLTANLVARSKSTPGPFAPKPFIRTFETTIERLLTLRNQISNQTQSLNSSVQVAESAYISKLSELSNSFKSVESSFSNLESKISEVGKTAIRIGEQLESVDRQRNRAQEAKDLVEHYYAFARGDTSRLDQMRKDGGKEGRLKTAVVARRLQAISREVDVEGADKTRDLIDAYCERFERDMLKLFDKFYRRSDPRTMAHIAKVLTSFNGGQSSVQIYVNQHDFFISKDRIGEAGELGENELWTHLSDPEVPPPKSLPSLTSLFTEIRSTVEVEAQIISAVFPSPLIVMQTFLQRVFAQSVQGYVEVLMTKAAEIGTESQTKLKDQISSIFPVGSVPNDFVINVDGFHSLAFLRALRIARSSALNLINDLKLYDYRGMLGSSTSTTPGGSLVTESHTVLLGNGLSIPTSATGSSNNSLTVPGGGNSEGSSSGISSSHLGIVGAGGTSLSVMLDQSVDELFVPYMEGNRYLEKEMQSLKELYNGCLAKFNAFHKGSQKVKTATLFDRIRTQVSSSSSSAANTGVGLSSTTANSTQESSSSLNPTTSSLPSTKSTFMKLSGLVDRARGATTNAIPSNNSTSGNVDSNDSEMSKNSEVGNGNDHHHHHHQNDEIEGDLSLELAERILRWHAEAIGRCVDLSSASDVPKNTFSLLKVLADAFHKSYVETALDSALNLASSQDVRSATLPDISPLLAVVHQVELIENLWQHYVNTAILPLTSSSVTVRREVVIFNNHNLLRVEGKCDLVLQKVTDNVISYLSARLATQKKNDFTPKNDELAFSRMNTEPCLACTEALEKIQLASKSKLSAKNSEAFLTEIGITFHGMLLDHLRKYNVSATGGLMLTKDLAMYQDAVSSFNIPAVSDRYEMLRQLGNLFIVQPGVLKSYMQEAHLAKIEERLLTPYLLRRADYAKDVRDLDAGPREGGSEAPSAWYGEGGMGSLAEGANEDVKVAHLTKIMKDLESWSGSKEQATESS